MLLGVPASAAPQLAAQAVARAGDASSRPDGGLDLDVVLLAELVAAHQRDRRAWWLRAPTPADVDASDALAPVVGALDALTTSARVRVVLEAVAMLAPEQIDEVVAVDVEPPADLVRAVARAAQQVPVEPPDPGRLVRAARSTRSPRRALSLGAVVGLLVLALLVAASSGAVVRSGVAVVGARLPVPEAETTLTSLLSVLPGSIPVPWYAGGVLHLGLLDVALPDVVALEAGPSAVLATTADGRVLSVEGDGAITPVARVSPASSVAASKGNATVAFVASTGPRSVTVYDTARGAVVDQVPVDLQGDVAAVVDDQVFVNDSDGYFVAGSAGAARRTNGVTVLDAAAGVLAVTVVGSPGEVRLVRDGLPVAVVAGEEAQLSVDGRFALVSFEDGSPAPRVVSLASAATVNIAFAGDGDTVTDAAFARDGTLVLVVRGPRAAPSLDRDDPDLTPRRSDLVLCSITIRATCVRGLRLGAASRGPLLAH